MTKGLALELAPRKIRVNAIAPGHTETEGSVAAGTFDSGAGAVLADKTPLGRLGCVANIAPLAVFLASDESAWITGENIPGAPLADLCTDPDGNASPLRLIVCFASPTRPIARVRRGPPTHRDPPETAARAVPPLVALAGLLRMVWGEQATARFLAKTPPSSSIGSDRDWRSQDTAGPTSTISKR